MIDQIRKPLHTIYLIYIPNSYAKSGLLETPDLLGKMFVAYALTHTLPCTPGPAALSWRTQILPRKTPLVVRCPPCYV